MRHCFPTTLLTAFVLSLLSLTLHAQIIWQPAGSLPSMPQLNGVAFADDHTVIAVGDSGTIVRSTDGGMTWSRQESGVGDIPESDLRGVSFGSALTGTVSGGNPIVLRTTDGGSTWTRQQNGVPTQLRLQRPFFVDENFGVIAAIDPMLLTRDGGETWEEFFFPKGWGAKEDPAAQAFWMFDSSDGCALALVGHGFGGVVMQSQGTMYDWEIATDESFLPVLTSLAFADRTNGFAVGDSGTVLTTTDGGSTWSPQQRVAGATLYDVAFTDAMNGIAVGDAGTILATSEGGATWHSEWSDTSYGFRGIAYRNGVAFAVGRDGAGRGVVLRRVDAAGSVEFTSEAGGVRLEGVIPNPAVGTAVVRYSVSRRSEVRVSIVDALGREVALLQDEEVAAGAHSVTLDGSQLSAGVWFVRIGAGRGFHAYPVVIAR